MDVKRVLLRFAGVLGLVVGMGITATFLLSPGPVSYAAPQSPPSDLPRLLADTLVSSDITADTTWGVAGSPYVISDTAVTVQTGIVLTIQPGVTVFFAGTDAALEVAAGARLVAVGTPSQPITFTSYQTSSPGAGDWIGIRLQNDALTSTLQHALIEYADYGLRIGSSDATHSVLSSTIRHTAGEGIGGSPDYALIAHNTIYGCGGAGISMVGSGVAIPGVSNVITGNVIYGNSAEGIHAEFQHRLTIQGNHVYANAADAGWAAIRVSSSQNGLALRENWVHDNGGGSNENYVAALYLIPQVTSDRGVQIVDNVIREEHGDGIRYTALTDDENPYLLGNAICVPTSLGVPFGLAKWTGVNDAPATGNWWGTNTPLFGWNIWGTVDYDPWIVFGLTEAGSPPYPADGVTPVTVTVSLNDGSGNTVFGVARTITVETSGGSFVGGGTVVTVTLDDVGEADVALIAPAYAGSVVLTATDYCGTAIAFPLQLEGTDLAIAKAGGGYAVGPGEAITYTISYSKSVF